MYIYIVDVYVSDDSDSQPREDMTDSDSSPAPYATTKEKYLNGLLKRACPIKKKCTHRLCRWQRQDCICCKEI